ncbi:MAG TPA: hypothetical protein DCZ95_16625, partial [Verrucomicrobia bacterium]|nr:hypothetical protein [Verrucomicrobiota bacterium]
EGVADRCVFRGNSAGNSAGACSMGTARNCLFVENSAYGGGACVAGRSENCTFVSNHAGDEGGGAANQFVFNSLFYSNTPDDYIEHNFSGHGGSGSPVGCISNSTLTPARGRLLANVAAGDYRPLPGSRCQDRGVNLPWMDGEAVDLAGHPRIVNGTADQGAYELGACGRLLCHTVPQSYEGLAPHTAVFQCFVVGSNTSTLFYEWDFDDDGQVDLSGPDLACVSNVFASCGMNPFSVTVRNDAGETSTDRDYLTIYPAMAFVSPSGSSEYPYTNWETAATNPQDALNASGNGSVVWVADGNYPIPCITTEAYAVYVPFMITNGIRLQSVNPRWSTLDGRGRARCLEVRHPDAVVDGFVIQHAGSVGAWVESGTLLNCLVRDNPGHAGVLAGSSYLAVTARIARCVISGNGAGIVSSGYDGVMVDECLVSSNGPGGGIRVEYRGVIRRSSIIGNWLEGAYAAYGGGVTCYERCRIEDCLIRDNRVHTTNHQGRGGGVMISGSNDIINCTMVGNSADIGGGVSSPFGSYGRIVNSIIWSNTAIVSNSNCDLARVTISRSCTQPPQSGEGNLCEEPGFVDVAQGDFHLAMGSPCIDAGASEFEPSVDLDGAPRPLDGNHDGVAAFDMGCYEFAHPLADSDGDTLTDASEVAMGINPMARDSDGDGADDREEGIAGTDAGDGASVFAVRTTEPCADGFVVRWSSAPDRTYALIRSTNLLEDFSILADDIPATPPENCYTDTVAQAEFHAYQVQVRE